MYLFKATGGAPGIILRALCKKKLIFVVSENQEPDESSIVPRGIFYCLPLKFRSCPKPIFKACQAAY